MFFSIRWLEQQSGPQQGWLLCGGLLARMKAERNLPSTCGAISSTRCRRWSRKCGRPRCRRCAWARGQCRRSRPRRSGAVVLLLQRAGDAADPQQHALANCVGNRPVDDHVRHSESPAGTQHAERLAQHAVLVRREIDHAVRDDDINGGVRQGNVLDLAFEELDVRDTGLALIFACQRQHVVGHIQAIGFAGGAYARADKSTSMPPPEPRSSTVSPGAVR